MFTPEVLTLARLVLDRARQNALRITTAESCTGGLVGAALTEVPGSSDVFERGFVTYSNAAKSDLLGVAAEMIAESGAVSEVVARAMAEGALRAAPAQVAVSITGIAGPGGGSPSKPVGLVHFASARIDGRIVHRSERFGDIGRSEVRAASLVTALKMLHEQVS